MIKTHVFSLALSAAILTTNPLFAMDQNESLVEWVKDTTKIRTLTVGKFLSFTVNFRQDTTPAPGYNNPNAPTSLLPYYHVEEEEKAFKVHHHTTSSKVLRALPQDALITFSWVKPKKADPRFLWDRAEPGHFSASFGIYLSMDPSIKDLKEYDEKISTARKQHDEDAFSTRFKNPNPLPSEYHHIQIIEILKEDKN